MTPATLDCPPPDPDPRAPIHMPPVGACDCHAHVIGPAARYPFVSDRSYTPPDALLPDYLRVLKTLGLQRAVLVQPSMHGTDNSAMLDAIASLDPKRDPTILAVAVVSPDIRDEELESLHRKGVRGIRLNLMYRGGGVDLSVAQLLAERIRHLGWHLQVLMDVSGSPGLMYKLGSLPVPLVVDHMGCMPASAGTANPGFRALLELVRRGNTWIKLSGPYRLTGAEFPYDDVRRFAEALIDAAPDRMIWGTDWPHTVCRVSMPNDGNLVELLNAWLGSPSLFERVLVKNPVALYGFPATPNGLAKGPP